MTGKHDMINSWTCLWKFIAALSCFSDIGILYLGLICIVFQTVERRLLKLYWRVLDAEEDSEVKFFGCSADEATLDLP